MASRGSLDALLGRLFENGTELELRGGLNFIGISLTANEAEDRYDLEIDVESISAAGSSGAVQYNDAGVFAGAALVTIVDSGNGIKAAHFDGPGTVPGSGHWRLPHGFLALALNADEDQIVPLMRWGVFLDGLLYFGSSSSDTGKVESIRWGVDVGGDFVWEVDGAGVASLGATGVMAATAFAGSGTVASDGTFRFGNDVGGAVGRTTGGDPVLVSGYIDGSNNSLYGRRTGPYVCAGNTAWWIDDAGTYYWRGDDGAADTDWMALSAAGVNLLGRLLIGVTNLGCNTINGATVAAPVEGAQITTTATINVGQGNNRTVTAAGGAYAITLGTTGSPFTGEIISLICSNSLANAVTVTNGGGGGGNIGPSGGTMPSGAKLVCDFVYDGTDWSLAGVKRLA